MFKKSIILFASIFLLMACSQKKTSISIQYDDLTSNIEQQKQLVEEYNKTAVEYFNICDYRTSYELLMKALHITEKINYEAFQPRIYNNIGNIYYQYKQYDMAKPYYSKALSLSTDTTAMVVLLNNLGSTELENGKTDSARYYLNESLRLSKLHNDVNLCNILNNLASLYQKEQQPDSAYYYYQLSLDEAKRNHDYKIVANNLSDLGNLFYEGKKTDSALFYLNQSNIIAKENSFLSILAKNYLTMSKIEESKGETATSFRYYKMYSNLKDSVYNAESYGDINQLQHLYEISKTHQQIEQLAMEQQIKERTIYYQKIIQIITLFIILLMGFGLLYIYLQKRNLSSAYKTLFEKNVEIIELQDKSSEESNEKYKKSALKNNMQHELLDRILDIMKNTVIFCDTEFSLDKLADLVQTNHAYVSQVINTVLKKNFRSFLNNYRIREAQRLFAEPDATKYTIEFVSLQVGFKSQNAFRHAFKEITGVSPNFYFKSLHG